MKLLCNFAFQFYNFHQKTEAQLAYELQAAKIQQRIRNEEIQIQVVERRKQIEIEEQEIKRKEKELTATVKLPAEAEAYKVQTVAEGNRTKVVESAKADGEKIRLIGGAEARAVEAVGRAEAESMRMKASAYKQYGDAVATPMEQKNELVDEFYTEVPIDSVISAPCSSSSSASSLAAPTSSSLPSVSLPSTTSSVSSDVSSATLKTVSDLDQEDREEHLNKFEVCVLNKKQRAEFNDFFRRGIVDVEEPLFQSWLKLKRAALPSEAKALEAVLANVVPKSLPRKTSKRKIVGPTGPDRNDPCSAGWVQHYQEQEEKEKMPRLEGKRGRGGRARGRGGRGGK